MSEYPDRTQLQQIIAGLKEGVLLVEPDRAFTYANHSFLEMHGVRELDELGRSVEDYLREHVAFDRAGQAIGAGRTPIERAVAGEAFDILVDMVRRADPDRRRTLRVRSLVVTTSAGLPDCHALVSVDMTSHVEAEERFECMFSANPAPALICRLSDLRYVRANEGFLQLSGFAREEVLGRSVYEVDVLERAESRETAIQRLRRGETIPQMEACLSFPNDPEHYVIVAGQPLEIGAEACMLFTFADLEDRRKAEQALARSEERFAKAFRLSPVPTMVGTIDSHRYVDVNDAFVSTMGYRLEEMVGRTADDLELWADAAERRRFEAIFAETGSVREFEARFCPKGGPEIDCLVSAEMVAINGHDCVLSAFQDITERRRSEVELVSAIEAAMADTTWFSRGVMDKLVAFRRSSNQSTSTARLQDLTGREREILGLICRGVRDPEIGRELRLSPHTVRNHVAAIYKKLGLNRRSDVVIWARELGVDGAPSRSA